MASHASSPLRARETVEATAPAERIAELTNFFKQTAATQTVAAGLAEFLVVKHEMGLTELLGACRQLTEERLGGTCRDLCQGASFDGMGSEVSLAIKMLSAITSFLKPKEQHAARNAEGDPTNTGFNPKRTADKSTGEKKVVNDYTVQHVYLRPGFVDRITDLLQARRAGKSGAFKPPRRARN